ncbi:MAG: hypothetical protein ACXIT9_12460 [Nitritalea sp.]
MLNNIKSKLSNHAVNLFGKRIKNRIVVIESDDWGSIRTPLVHNYNDFRNKFGPFFNPYLKFDSLASVQDLCLLFEVLSKFKDSYGKHPVVTFNTVVANPNFELIKNNNFLEYYYEPFTDTLDRYFPNDRVFEYWKDGINNGLIYPQFHGREHVNVPVWLSQLQAGNTDLKKAFDYMVWSTPNGKYQPGNIKLQASLDYFGTQPVYYQKSFITEGLNLFENIFGFRSESMIANNFTWNDNLHSLIHQSQVKILQGMKYQVFPVANNLGHTFVRRYFGQSDNHGITFNVRNCFFEPSQTNESFDDVGFCLNQINNAFFWNKPAVISSHRLNFIGTLCEKNRKNNLQLLEKLIKDILLRWPDVAFVHSIDLFDKIK